MAYDLEAGPHVLQGLGHVCPQFAQPSAIVGACLMARQMRVDFARKMLGQGTAEWLRRCGTLCGRKRLRLLDGTGGLQIFQLELELLDLVEDLLALRSEEHPLQLLNQQRQAFDLAREESFAVHLLCGAINSALVASRSRPSRSGSEATSMSGVCHKLSSIKRGKYQTLMNGSPFAEALSNRYLRVASRAAHGSTTGLHWLLAATRSVRVQASWPTHRHRTRALLRCRRPVHERRTRVPTTAAVRARSVLGR